MKVKIGKRKNRKSNTIVDVLEALFVEWDPQVLDLLWKKDIFSNKLSNKDEFRDDLSYMVGPLV
jgi:hypothetical protein